MPETNYIEKQGSMAMGDEPSNIERGSRASSAIFVLLCSLPVFTTILFGGVDSATWILIIFCATAIFLLWLAETRNVGGFPIGKSNLPIPLAALILIGLIQLAPLGGGEHAGISTSTALSSDPFSTRLFVVRLLVYFVFFSACLTFINNEGRIKKATIFIIVFGALMAFFAILQRLANPDGIYGMRETPQAISFGPFVNQHHFASFMQMTAGVTLGLLLGSSIERDRKVLLGILFVAMGVAAVWTSSRGGLVGFIAVIIMAALLSFVSRGEKHREKSTESNQKLIAAGTAAALLLVIFGVVLMLGGGDLLLRGTGVGVEGGDLSTGRAHFWPIALRIFFENPVLGAGLDAFGAAFTKHDTWNGMLRVEQAHNEYLQILADAGIAGIACLAAFIFLLFRGSLKVIASGSGFRREAAVGALAGCFGILIHSFFDFPLRTPSNAFFFLMLAVIATVPVAIVNKARMHRRRSSSEH